MTYSLFDSYRSLKVPVKYVMDDLVMLWKLCNTFSSRVSYRNICQCMGQAEITVHLLKLKILKC